MNVILSIKQEYCDKIQNGTKKYEFRRTIFKQKNMINKVYMYSTSPIKKIVGSFRIDDIIEDEPITLWRKCNGSSGISENEFFNYFRNKQVGYAIKIKDVEFFHPINPYNIIPNFYPPQSFCYLEENLHCTRA